MAHQEPPDGGYGWIIVMAAFVSQFLRGGITFTLAIFYVIFLEEMEGNKASIALATSLYTTVLFVTGPVSSLVEVKFGGRLATVIGGAIGSVGVMLSGLFATNVIHLYFTFGIITGFGLGLTVVPVVNSVGQYFTQKRTVALGIAASGGALGSFFFPSVIRYLVKEYGWRHGLVLFGALCLNTCVCGALLRPLQRCKTPAISSKETDNGFISSLHLHVFRNFHFVLLCLNNTLFYFGLSIVYVHISAYAKSQGFTDDEAVVFASVLGLGNFLGRVIFGLIGRVPFVNTVFLYTSGMFASGILVLCFPLVTSQWPLLAVTCLFGLMWSPYVTLYPQMIVLSLDVSLLSTGIGYILLFCAAGPVTGPPIAGMLYETLGVYSPSFYLGGSVMILAGTCMLPLLLKPKHKAVSQHSDLELHVDMDRNKPVYNEEL